MKRLLPVFALIIISAAALINGLLRPDTATTDRTESNWYQSEKARLERSRLHAEQESAQDLKLQGKLAKLEDWRRGVPRAGYPSEFARILDEMRIPADREVPEYEAGYLYREMAKARRTSLPQDKSIAWRSRGPGNVAGRAREILVDPDDASGSTWFVASAGGGVWHTEDAGASWTPLMDDQPQLSTQALAMAPSSTNILLAGTGESYFTQSTMNGNGLLRSTDKGATWAPVASTVDDPRFNNVSRILISPTNPDLVLVSTTVGRYKAGLYPTTHIFRSTDGGANWTEVFVETNGGTYDARVQQLLVDPADFNIQYATVNTRGILKSTDAGLTWNYINTGITDMTGRFELAISPVSSSFLYASAEGASSSKLWVSWNGGLTWTDMSNAGGSDSWLGGQGYYDNAIVCHPTDARIVIVGGLELFQLTINFVGGNSYTAVPLGSYSFPHPDHHDLVIVPQTAGDWYLLGTSDGGVTRTASGIAGVTMPMQGMVTTQFYGMDKCPGASVYIGGMQDNGTWRSGVDPSACDPWELCFYGDGFEADWHFNDPQKIIGSVYNNRLMRSLDGGVSWASAIDGLEDVGAGAAAFVTKIGSSWQRPDDIFAVGAQGVWRSTDFGGYWTLAPISADRWGDISSFHDVRVSGAAPDIVWAGGRMDDTADIMVSVDAGITFFPTNDYVGAVMGGISGLATHPTEPATAYALFSFAERPKILKTSDLGTNWTDISGFGSGSVSSNGFPDVAIYDLLVWPNDPQRIWVGTEIGLVESIDGGTTWALANNGLPAVGIWFLKAVEDEIIIGTHGRGIWTMTAPELADGLLFNPLLLSMGQIPTGMLELSFNLRSVYSVTEFWVDNVLVKTVDANTAGQLETLRVPVPVSKTVTAFARSRIGVQAYPSNTGQAAVSASLLPSTSTFDNDLNDGGDVPFDLEGFAWTTPSGFSNPALHTDHNYVDGGTYVATLLAPIRISTNSNLSFDEIAMVEPGEPGSVFGYPGFWDYAVVEGTSDGVTWKPVAPGWDVRSDDAWLARYYDGLAGADFMYINRSIPLSDTFSAGEFVMLRWRLDSDVWGNGWGWAVDNIVVTSAGVTTAGDPPRAVGLDQNYPNPFNPRTNISFNLKTDERIKLSVYDVRGRRVRTLVDDHRSAGSYVEEWDGRDESGMQAASGVYMARLVAGDQVWQRKMTLVR
jgi:Sortilin, neurotensin receptor 3,/FlgD Ig-like domain